MSRSKNKKQGSGFSADYRGAFDKPAEKEAVDPVIAESESGDFLPEDHEDPDEELLTKWSEKSEPAQQPVSSEELPEELPESKPAVHRRGRRRYGVAAGSLVLLFALAGVIFLVGALGRQIYSAATDDSGLRAYDTFLTPVVMQDPQPFASPDKAPDDFVLNASLWKAITANNGTNYTDYDDAGKVLVPLGDVVQACRDLFGPSCQLQPKTPAQETFFTFNAEENKFHVALYSSDSTFTPYTVKADKQGDSIVLRVGYVSPGDTWRNQTSSTVSAPKPTKYMNYVLKTDSTSKKEYIYAVQAAS